MLASLLQQRNLSIYIVAGVTAAGVLLWRQLPPAWITVRRVIVMWLIAAEWLILYVR